MSIGAGTRLGPYEIVSPLGAGGMGEVYRARDTRLNRDVAIKVLPASFAADTDRLQRFMREAHATSALNHPNILAVFDVGTHDNAPYLVSELLKGETLAARLATGPLPASKAIDFGRQIATGLAAAHEQGITHRDIKPANLFVTTDGRVKILDFGLAKQSISQDADVTRPQSLTEAGAVMGTLGYMSPEQVRGQKTDARTDIFSFGAVLYEMLTAKRAFTGASAVETMHAILQSDPPELPGTTLHASPALGRIIARCLEKDPADRFHSAHDLGLALESIAGGAGSGAAPVATAASRGPSGLSRIATWVAIAIAAGAMGALLHRHFATPAVDAAVTMESLTYSGHDTSPAASPDGKAVAFTSDRDGVSRIWLKQVAGGGELALTTGSDDYPAILARRLDHHLCAHDRRGPVALPRAVARRRSAQVDRQRHRRRLVTGWTRAGVHALGVGRPVGIDRRHRFGRRQRSTRGRVCGRGARSSCRDGHRIAGRLLR